MFLFAVPVALVLALILVRLSCAVPWSLIPVARQLCSGLEAALDRDDAGVARGNPAAAAARMQATSSSGVVQLAPAGTGSLSLAACLVRALRHRRSAASTRRAHMSAVHGALHLGAAAAQWTPPPHPGPRAASHFPCVLRISRVATSRSHSTSFTVGSVTFPNLSIFASSSLGVLHPRPRRRRHVFGTGGAHCAFCAQGVAVASAQEHEQRRGE